MSKYHNDAVKLLELIGGKENVVAVTHCATRMRFSLADEEKQVQKKLGSLILLRERLQMRDNFK